MAKRLNGNKGYFSLVFWEALIGATQTGLTLSLINVPLALVTAVLDFSAVMAGGIIRGPKTAAPAQAPAPETATPQKTSLLKRGKSFVKRVGVYYISGFKDPEYQVGFSAAGAGLLMCFQAMWGLEKLITSHSALTIAGFTFSLPLGLGVGVCLGFAALGLTAVIAGNLEKGKGLNKYYHKAAGKKLPDPAPPKRKGAIRSFFDRPRVSPVASAVSKTVLLGMTIQTSLFAFITSGSVIYQKAAAMVASPQAILPGILPLAIALKWGGGAAWYLISAGRVAARGARGKKDKKTVATETVTRPAEPQAAPNAKPLEKALTEDFEQAVQKQKPNTPPPAAPQQKPPIHPNF